MKKLIYLNLFKNIFYTFVVFLLVLGLIVWAIQAVNYFDIVSEDGHGLKVYFLFSFLSFPKILNRLIPFIFFISLFYQIILYINKNEIILFWINGISKIKFVNKILVFSILIMLLQIFLGAYISPKFQFKAREILKNSDVNFFTTLIKAGKFINVAKDITIFIEKKNNDQTYSNIFIEDNRNLPKMIYANNGELLQAGELKIFNLKKGNIVSENKEKKNIISFDQINFNLSNIDSNTITVAKIQEIKSDLLLECLIDKSLKSQIFNCEYDIFPKIKQEIFKRFIKPFYIPLIGLITTFLIIFSNKKYFVTYKKIIFIFSFLILVFSEASVRYFSINNLYSTILIIIPFIIFLILYFLFYKFSKNV